MRLTNRALIEQCLQRIEILKLHQTAVIAAGSLVNQKVSAHDQIDYGAFLSRLMQLELHEWRDLFMWCLTIDDPTRERIKAMAYERFLAEGNSVTKWFMVHEDAVTWLKSDEDEFREMARRLFQPSQTDPVEA